MVFNYINNQFLLLVLLAAFVSTLWATETDQLYEIEIPISKDGSFEQAKCLHQAFQEMLVRASGSEKILKSEQIRNALEKTDKYVNQFSYHQQANGQKTIRVVFSEALIKELLNTAKQPIWTQKRPLTLVWLVVDREEAISWVNNDSETKLAQMMEQNLKRRGIPLVFPLLDLTDVAQVSEKDIKDNKLELCFESAKRYQTDTVLVGHLNQISNGWQGHWTLMMNGTTTSWKVTKSDVTAVLNETAEIMAAKISGYEPVASTSVASLQSKTNHLLLSVSGILNAEHYNQVSAYLQGLPFVVQVEVEQILPEKTIFSVQTTCEKEEIVKSIALGELLIEAQADTANINQDSNTKQELSYKIAGASI
jgi:hypothetical protein